MTAQTKNLLIGLLVAAVIGYAAYYWYSKMPKDSAASNTGSTPSSNAPKQANTPVMQVSNVQSASSGLTADSILKVGDKGEIVKAVQNLLKVNGFLGKNGKPLATDGSLGQNTMYAIEQAVQLWYEPKSLNGVRNAIARKNGTTVPTQQQSGVGYQVGSGWNWGNS